MGMKLKLKRIENNLKQYELAKRVNISPQYLRLLEKDKANPTKDIMERIAKELNSNIDELFFS
jgi:putative transcriptional regulator